MVTARMASGTIRNVGAMVVLASVLMVWNIRTLHPSVITYTDDTFDGPFHEVRHSRRRGGDGDGEGRRRHSRHRRRNDRHWSKEGESQTVKRSKQSSSSMSTATLPDRPPRRRHRKIKGMPTKSSTSPLPPSASVVAAVKDVVTQMGPPTDNNTVVAIVAMHHSAKSFLSHRFVRSLRARGEFTGHILVLTDEVGYHLLAPTLQFGNYHALDNNNKTIVIQGKPDHLHPTWPSNHHQNTNNNNNTTPVGSGAGNTTNAIRYGQRTVIYKRFKTLLEEYVTADPYLHSTINYILYLDVDNVVASPIRDLFQDYYDALPGQLLQVATSAASAATAAATIASNNTVNHNVDVIDFSFFSFWRDPANRNRWQGGQTMHHRNHSKDCNLAWRYQMDHSPDLVSDQWMLNRALKLQQQQLLLQKQQQQQLLLQKQQQQQSLDYSALPDHDYYNITRPCQVLALPHRDRHLEYATAKLLLMSDDTDDTDEDEDEKEEDPPGEKEEEEDTTKPVPPSSSLPSSSMPSYNSTRLPTLVHITGLRTRRVNATIQRAFLRSILNLKETIVSIDDKGGGTEAKMTVVVAMEDESNSPYMARGVLWDQVAQPVGASGERAKENKPDGDDGKRRRGRGNRRRKRGGRRRQRQRREAERQEKKRMEKDNSVRNRKKNAKGSTGESVLDHDR